MKKILRGKDIAKEHGFEGYREWIKGAWQLNKNVGRWNGKIAQGPPMVAFIERGRWIAMCECNGGVWVDPGDPIAFCHTCGNSQTGGAARPVTFPSNYKAIEAELLTRPMHEIFIGTSEVSRALQSRPILPALGREWRSGEKLADLRAQKKAAEIYAGSELGGAS